MTDHADTPVMILRARRVSDEFAQIVRATHFKVEIEVSDCNDSEMLAILAQSLHELTQKALLNPDTDRHPDLQQTANNLLRVLSLPHEAITAAGTAQFLRNHNPKDDQ